MASTRPWTITTAAWITIAMATVIAVVAIWDVASGETTGARLGTNAYYVAVALILVPASISLLSGHGWPRGVLVTTHLILILSMISLASLLTWFAVTVAAISALVIACLATPSARTFLAAGRSRGFPKD